MTDREQPPDTLYSENTVEVLLRRVIDIITNTRTLPFASSVKLDNKDEVLALLEDACERLPEELRQARWLLKEREEFLEKMQREGDDIVEAARLRAERMVERTEIVREAQHVARRTMDDARDEARRLRLEAEDYCDQKLAAFQIVLERTMKTVQSGREKLSVTPLPPADGPDRLLAGGGEVEDHDMDFFDQDRS
jgi:cell division septum initiation protein DivIVA